MLSPLFFKFAKIIPKIIPNMQEKSRSRAKAPMLFTPEKIENNARISKNEAAPASKPFKIPRFPSDKKNAKTATAAILTITLKIRKTTSPAPNILATSDRERSKHIHTRAAAISPFKNLNTKPDLDIDIIYYLRLYNVCFVFCNNSHFLKNKIFSADKKNEKQVPSVFDFCVIIYAKMPIIDL